MTGGPTSLPEADGQLGLSEELLAETYDALRRIASRQLSRQSSTPSLNTTLVVHEAWLKLAGSEDRRFNDRNHYLATAARAMRQILVDHARRKATDKRGAGAMHLDIDACVVADAAPMDAVLTVEEALEALAGHAPDLEPVVECRFFGGLTTQETADALGRSVRTVERQWARARAYLVEQFQPD
ncbi:ECF-type sigma factor [Sphingosinithalassobacter portus]|uniref:ECF-type sigma factor n=1 Tax=Stakelama portus TaxID=2676234 RepID=UPI00137B6966|nr:ECF-type sigma factor [Sphingosinithalassobacter portus]